MVLSGNLTLLVKEDARLSSDTHVQKIAAAAEHIASMIQFTKEYEEIGVKAPTWTLVQKTIESGAASVTLGTVELIIDIPQGMELFADPLIMKVFHNLIDNAVKHGSPLSRIHFQVEQREEARAIICQDDGMGIRAEDRERLFERGFGKNHGLGLFLSREILAITGITITETGKDGQGARFEIVLPPGVWRFPPAH
jgi:signal transduction histidine kinase